MYIRTGPWKRHLSINILLTVLDEMREKYLGNCFQLFAVLFLLLSARKTAGDRVHARGKVEKIYAYEILFTLACVRLCLLAHLLTANYIKLISRSVVREFNKFHSTVQKKCQSGKY